MWLQVTPNSSAVLLIRHESKFSPQPEERGGKLRRANLTFEPIFSSAVVPGRPEPGETVKSFARRRCEGFPGLSFCLHRKKTLASVSVCVLKTQRPNSEVWFRFLTAFLSHRLQDVKLAVSLPLLAKYLSGRAARFIQGKKYGKGAVLEEKLARTALEISRRY